MHKLVNKTQTQHKIKQKNIRELKKTTTIKRKYREREREKIHPTKTNNKMQNIPNDKKTKTKHDAQNSKPSVRTIRPRFSQFMLSVEGGSIRAGALVLTGIDLGLWARRLSEKVRGGRVDTRWYC